MKPRTKPWYQSKTLYFNLLLLLLGVIEVFTTQNIFGEAGAQWLTTIAAIGNLVLRLFFTTRAVTFSQRPQDTDTPWTP